MKIFRQIKLLLATTLIISTLTSNASTNRNQVMDRLERGWVVGYGDHINHVEEAEYLLVLGSTYACTAASVGTAAPACFAKLGKYFGHKLSSTAQRIADDLARESLGRINASKHEIMKKIVKALKTKRPFRLGSIQIQAGLATYNHSKKVSYHVPRVHRCKVKGPFGSWTWGRCTKKIRKVKTVKLPNTFQPYVRYKINR